MLRMPLVTIFAREMRLNIFWSRPSFGDIASGASHDIRTRNAIEIFSRRPTRLEMLRVALVTILAREMRLNYFEVDQALEMLRVPLVTILVREMRLIFRSRPTFGDVASAASHDIGARNAIESFFNYIWCQTANNVTSRARKIFLKFVEKMWIFNRTYRANIVTSGSRSTPKACFVEKKLSIAFLAPTSWFAALARHSLRGLRMFQSHTPHQYLDKKASLLAIAWQHVSVSTAMAFKASDRRHHAAEFIRNPVGSYFHSQVFVFMRLSSLALPWIAILSLSLSLLHLIYGETPA